MFMFADFYFNLTLNYSFKFQWKWISMSTNPSMTSHTASRLACIGCCTYQDQWRHLKQEVVWAGSRPESRKGKGNAKHDTTHGESDSDDEIDFEGCLTQWEHDVYMKYQQIYPGSVYSLNQNPDSRATCAKQSASWRDTLTRTHVWFCDIYDIILHRKRKDDPPAHIEVTLSIIMIIIVSHVLSQYPGSQYSGFISQHHHEQPAQSLVDAQRSSCCPRPTGGHGPHTWSTMFIVCPPITFGEKCEAIHTMAK